MIPRIIHYCWFGGGQKSEKIQNCIQSWHEVLPDYRIVEWNENNFDVNSIPFVKEAYEHKKWAFVTDYARLYALYEYGGIYLDTDVEVLKPFDDLLDNEVFLGYESHDFVMTAVVGAEAGAPFVRELMEHYDTIHFVDENGSLNMLPNPYIFTEKLVRYGMLENGQEQIVNNIRIYKQDYFSPNNISRIWNHYNKSTYAVHHCEQSWRTSEIRDYRTVLGRIRRYCVGVGRNLIGTRRLTKLKSDFRERSSSITDFTRPSDASKGGWV